MLYLYIPYMLDGDSEYYSETGPTEAQAEESINDEIRIYRFKDSVIEIMTPIDNTDLDNWSTLQKI